MDCLKKDCDMHDETTLWSCKKHTDAMLECKDYLIAQTEPVAEVPCSVGLEGQDPTNAQVDSACLSYRHDYGLMTHEERTALQRQAREWLYAWQKEFGLR